MSWNYRIFKEDDVFTIRAVHYSSEGNPKMYSSMAIYALGETVTELHEDLELMRKAFDKSYLTSEDFTNGATDG